jgi:hypothetical protein
VCLRSTNVMPWLWLAHCRYKIVAHVPGRTAPQCRERWVNNLDQQASQPASQRSTPRLIHGIRARYVSSTSTDFKRHVLILPLRCANTDCWQVRNQPTWSPEDDRQLEELVEVRGLQYLCMHTY